MKSNKETGKYTQTFTLIDAAFVLSSIFTFFTDIGTDIIVTCKYFNHGHYYWAAMTIGILVVPAPIVQFFSIRWYYADNFLNLQLWLWHFCGLGVLKRYLDVLRLGFKMRRLNSMTEIGHLLQQQSDVCMLRLFESFLESAPQIVLQLYIMIATNHWTPWTGISALASLISLSWGVAAYSKAMRNVRVDKAHISWFGLTLQTIWRVGMVASRVTALVIFTVSFKLWIFFVLGVHWVAAFIWVTIQKTDFCINWWEERVYNCVVASIYCFCFFNLKEGRTRYRLSAFYAITFTENIILFLASYIHLTRKDNKFKAPGLLESAGSIITISYILGLSTMLLYYRFFHPSGPIPGPIFHCGKKSVPSVENEELPKIIEHSGSIAVRTLKYNRPNLLGQIINHETDSKVSTICNSYNAPVPIFSLRIDNRHNSLPCIVPCNTKIKKMWTSLPILTMKNINTDIASSEKPESQSSLELCEDLQLDSGLSEGSEQESASSSGHSFDNSKAVIKMLQVEQSPEIRKIKGQLGHSISFGDIPLFPPSRRKLACSMGSRMENCEQV